MDGMTVVFSITIPRRL